MQPNKQEVYLTGFFLGGGEGRTSCGGNTPTRLYADKPSGCESVKLLLPLCAGLLMSWLCSNRMISINLPWWKLANYILCFSSTTSL